jgi:hypothetical protein
LIYGSFPGLLSSLATTPIPQPEDLLGRLAWYKQVNGLTLEQLGIEMGRDPAQLAGKRQPSPILPFNS